jgi:tRNA (cytidine/uridine-2'-O-)-methyltransferase
VTYEPQLHIVLHQPEIPQNTGNVGRTCVAVGAKLWLVRPLGFRVDAHHLRRAGLDYWELLEWEVVDDFSELTSRLEGAGMWFFSKAAGRSYLDVQYQRGDALVFGSETRGLPAAMLERHRDRALRLPMRDEVRSLNLSNTVAVAAYEAIRQWGGRL